MKNLFTFLIILLDEVLGLSEFKFANFERM